jgi:FixJ family two-component response regulator
MNLQYARTVLSAFQATATPVVFVVDNDAEAREGVAQLVRSTGWHVVTAASAEEFLARPSVKAPHCLLLELELPGLSGLDLQRRVVERVGMPVIFMSRRADIHATVQAMKQGAFEFLTKPLLHDVLLDAIRGAIERSEAALRHSAAMQDLQQRYESLSRREREVMALVASGRLNKQVSSELGISEITVKAHRGNAMRKMRARSFAELVTMAGRLRPYIQQGAVDLVAKSERPDAHASSFVRKLTGGELREMTALARDHARAAVA